ncbi:MAG: DUF3857 domain-containing protein, partial [Acidobacteriota bacterium]|nr:DUF3857 domain-containing protein [Acidobacteriota bacterium]
QVRVMEKEDESSDRIYDGELTAVVFLKDVRPGDVLDYSWSLTGENPILGGRFADEVDLSSGVPSRHIRHRFLFPAARVLQWKGVKPSIRIDGDEQILTWEASDVPALDVEDGIPSWYEPWRSVQISEFRTWHDVALWSDAMFRIDDRSRAEVKKLADELRTAHKTRDEQITAAIRFVQDDIRYLGIEMGRNSHEPHQPWETLDARWGDCKDKTLLLTALLRELGLEAYPALVNTRLKQRLEEKLPSPFLFDHVITQVIDRGRTYWVDGTISDQGGSLATLDTPSDRRALIVRAETTGLTRVLTNNYGKTRVEQTYTTLAYNQPSALEVRTTYSGFDADAMRSDLTSMSLEDYGRDRINELAVDQPKIVADGVPAVKDDRLRNVIVVTERYRVPELWEGGHWTWYPRELEKHLSRPNTMIREMPLAFPYPLDVEQTVRFNFPDDANGEKSTSVTETPTFRYEYDVDSNGHTITIRQSLRALRDVVAAKDVPEHLTKLNAIWSEIGYRLAPDGAQTATAKSDAPPRSDAKWGLGIFLVAMFVGLAWMLATRKPRRRGEAVRRSLFMPGEAPASALAVYGEHDMHAHLSRLPCSCGASVYSNPDLQRARYAERDMTIVTRQCGACGREQSVYFTAA